MEAICKFARSCSVNSVMLSRVIDKFFNYLSMGLGKANSACQIDHHERYSYQELRHIILEDGTIFRHR